MGVNIKNIKDNIDASAIILLPPYLKDVKDKDSVQKVVVAGILQGEFGFSSKANYSSPFYNETIAKVTGMVNQISTQLQGFFGDMKIPNISLTSIRQTIKTWTMTDNPVFACSLLFICTEDDQDVRVPVAMLQRAIYPKFQSIESIGSIGSGLYLTAPNNYQLLSSNQAGDFGITATGLCVLNIGTWFMARNLLLTGVDPKFSEQKNINGYPMWALVAVSFEPFRMMDLDEVITLYKGLDVTNLDKNNKFDGRNIR